MTRRPVLTWRQQLRRNLITALLATAALTASYGATRAAFPIYRHLETALAVHVGTVGTPGTWQCNATRCWRQQP